MASCFSGSNLAQIRREKGLSQEELGLALGFDKSCARMKIAQFEVGHQTPRQMVAESIAKTLDVSLQDLIVTVDIGDRIRKVREAQGITSHELAEMAGLKNSYIVDCEKNQANIFRHLTKIAAALDVDVDVLCPEGGKKPDAAMRGATDAGASCKDDADAQDVFLPLVEENQRRRQENEALRALLAKIRRFSDVGSELPFE